MPDKKINITGNEAFKLGFIDKGFSGSVRRSSSEVSAARAKFAPEPTPPVTEVNYDPNKGQTINAKEAFKLGLVDKNFSGSVRRTRGEIDAARNSLSQPAQQPATPAQQPSTPAQQPASKPVSSSKPSTPKREKQQSAVTIDLSTFAKGAVPMSATSNFTKVGAISTASGGNTNYAAGLGLADTSGLKEKASFTAPAPTLSKKEARQEKRAKRLEGRIATQTAKGKTAVSEGRFIDAGNKQGRVQNLQKRVDRLRK